MRRLLFTARYYVKHLLAVALGLSGLFGFTYLAGAFGGCWVWVTYSFTAAVPILVGSLFAGGMFLRRRYIHKYQDVINHPSKYHIV